MARGAMLGSVGALALAGLAFGVAAWRLPPPSATRTGADAPEDGFVTSVRVDGGSVPDRDAAPGDAAGTGSPAARFPPRRPRTASERAAPIVVVTGDDLVVVPHAPRPSGPEPAPASMPTRLRLDREGTDAATVVPAGALVTQAAPFDGDGRPRLAIVLFDDADARVDPPTLAGLGLPVTVVVDPARPDAAAVSAAHRAAGHEIAIAARALAPGGDARDVEIAFAAARAAVPQAIAVVEAEGSGFATDRAALAALLGPLAEAGMGFVAGPGGLGGGVAAAGRAGVPAAQVDRILDARGDDAAAVARRLDRAGFEAVQAGAVLVEGRASPAVVAAIRAWRDGPRATEVAVVPLSAILRGD